MEIPLLILIPEEEAFGPISPTIRNCSFTHNYAATYGGAIYLRDAEAGDAVLDNCVFEANDCGIIGGAVTVFTASADRLGGGIALFSIAGSDYFFAMSDCDLTQNISQGVGGGGFLGMYGTSEAMQMEITNCRLDSNRSNDGGGFGINLKPQRKPIYGLWTLILRPIKVSLQRGTLCPQV